MKMKIMVLQEEDNVTTMIPQEIEEDDIHAMRHLECGIFEVYLKDVRDKIRFLVPKDELARLVERDKDKPPPPEMTSEEKEQMKEYTYWKRYWKEHPDEYAANQARASQKEIGDAHDQGQ